MKRVYKTLKEMFDLLKLIHSLDRSMIPLYIITSFSQAVEPFITIIGNAMIIDSLLLHDWKQAMMQAGVMITGLFIFGILHSYLMKKKECASMAINRKCNGKICLKAISLDYATFEDKKNLEEFEAADYNVSRNGGFGMYLLELSNMLTGCFSFMFAIGFLINLCLMESQRSTPFDFLTSTKGSLIIVTVIMILLIFLYMRFSKYVNQNNLKLYYEMVDVNQKLGYFSNRLCSDEKVAKEIRLYHMKDMIYTEWKKFTMEAHQFLSKQWSFERLSLMTSSFLNDAVLLLAYLFVVIKAYAGAITIGSFTQYVGSIQQLNDGLRKMAEAVNQLIVKQSYLSFYIDFINKENQMDTGTLPVEKRNDNEFEIEFHDVSYHYPGSDMYVLKHVSVKLDMKNHFAVVGRNGAGKTTFIKLLCRMYDVSEGMITLNGIDIRKYDYEEYLNLFAAVFQDFALFSFPIDENIACSRDVDEKRVWNVLDCAGMKERVEKLRDGIHTLLFHQMGDGVDISGGEAQKLAIARALYKDAPFVILDEPTAALDPISEYEIYSHFHEMVKNKTSIYISHRMSSCRFCDDILVFDQGELVQRGNHEALLKDTKGVYATLWNAQAQYYNDHGAEEVLPDSCI